MTKQWKCKQAAYVSGFGIVRPGKIIDIEDGCEPEIVKIDFECMTQSQVNDEKEKTADEEDMTFAAKIERLKDMKIRMPRGMKKKEIERLFEEHISKVELPEIIR